MNADSRRRLEAFIERIADIEKYSFYDGGENIAGAIIRSDNDGHSTIEFHGPTDEQLDAILLHVRVLIQRDDIAIGRMAELCDDPGVSDAWKREFGHWRAQLNERLRCVASEKPGEVALTHKDVLNMFLHGRRGHFKKEDAGYRLYEKWVVDEMSRQILRDTFHQVVIWILALAHNIAAASREELARHDKIVAAEARKTKLAATLKDLFEGVHGGLTHALNEILGDVPQDCVIQVRLAEAKRAWVVLIRSGAGLIGLSVPIADASVMRSDFPNGARQMSAPSALGASTSAAVRTVLTNFIDQLESSPREEVPPSI